MRWMILVLLGVLWSCSGEDHAIATTTEDWDRPRSSFDGRFGVGRIVAPEGVFVDVAVSARQSCAVRADGELLCWGDVVGEVPEGAFARVSLGDRGGCAVRADGAVACWHDGSWGEFDLPEGRFVDVLAS